MSTRECEITIGTTHWRCTLSSDGLYSIAARLPDGSWSDLAAGDGGVEGMRWAAEKATGVPEFSPILEQFAEMMVLQ